MKKAEAAELLRRAKQRRETMPTAIVVLTGSEGVSGSLTFTADGASTHLTGEITGLAPGLHGLHVHQVRFCRAGVLEGGTFWWGAGAARTVPAAKRTAHSSSLCPCALVRAPRTAPPDKRLPWNTKKTSEAALLRRGTAG